MSTNDISITIFSGLGHNGAEDADNRETPFPWKHHPGHRRGLLRRGEAGDTVYPGTCSLFTLHEKTKAKDFSFFLGLNCI